MDLRVLATKIVAAARESGVGGVGRAAARHLWRSLRGTPVDDFDRRHGTDTSGELAIWQTTVSSPNARFGTRYQASGEDILLQIVNSLGIDSSNFTFIDLGCGKGRTLLVAAKLGFRRVIGVEISAELADIARTNLARLNVTNALVIHGDAAEYAFPSGGLLVYLYNPFGPPVMSQVIRALENRIEHGEADEIYLAYQRPTCAPLLDQSKCLRRVTGTHGLEHTAIWKGTGR